MRAAQLDPAIKSISGSPVSAHDAKYLSASAHPAACTTFSEIYPNSSKTGTAENNNRTSPTSSSPSSGRTHDVRSARTWRARQDGDFVSTLHHGTDDPFISSGDTQESQPSGMMILHVKLSDRAKPPRFFRSFGISSRQNWCDPDE